MPFSERQIRVFRAIQHGWKPRKGSLSRISRQKATEMASEGVKKRIGVSRALRKGS